jgi:hypothetical protein
MAQGVALSLSPSTAKTKNQDLHENQMIQNTCRLITEKI